MDKINMQILNLLIKDSRTSITDISKEVNLSRPSVKERIEKMKEAGIIKNFTLDLDYHKLGKNIIFFLNVSNINIPYNNFEEIIKKIDDVIEIHRVAGHNNYIMKIATKNTSTMNEILESLVEYCKVESSIIIDSIY